MLRVERHELGPRCYVLGRRVHEWQLGAAAAAAAAAALAAGALPESAAALLGAAGAWLVLKDWRDLFPATRDTGRWRLGIHRPVAPLRAPRRGERLPLAAAVSAGAAGAVNLVSALTPNAAWRGHVLLELEPVEAVPLFHALAVPASAVLLVVGVHLARRRRAAWALALAALLVVGLLDLLKGLDVEEAALSWGLAGALWWGRDAFPVRSDGPTLRALALRLPLLAAGTAVVAFAAAAAAAPPAAAPATTARDALDLLLGLPGPFRFGGDLHWVPHGVAAAAGLALAGAAAAAFRPLRTPRRPADARARAAAEALVRRHGRDTLAFFKLRRDARYLFSAGGGAFLGYTVERGVLLVAGDPVGSEDELPALVRETCAFAEARGLRLGVLGASAACVPLWRDAGLRALEIGDEAIVEPARFSLEGRAIRKVRQSVTRLEKAGYRAELRPLAELGPAERAELEAVSARWLAGCPERGFSMALDALHGDETLVAVARDAAGAARGFLHFVPTFGRPAVSLSAMRRDRATPNGLTEFLVARSLQALAARGVGEVSLNFAAFARVMQRPRTRGERLLGRLVALGERWFQIESLYRFNAKFDPRWEPRYVLWEGALGLPRTGLAALVAEGQVRLPALRRLPA